MNGNVNDTKYIKNIKDNINPEDMNLRDLLLQISSSKNNEIADEQASILYDRMREFMVNKASIGERKYWFNGKTFDVLYSYTQNWYNKMIEILKQKFKDEGLELEYVERDRDSSIFVINLPII